MNRIRTFLALVGQPETAPAWSLTTAALTVIFAFIAMLIGAAVALIWASTATYTQLAGWTIGGLLVAIFVWQTHVRDRDDLRLAPPQTPVIFIMFVAFGTALALDLLSLAVTGEFLPKPELLGLNPGALGVLDWLFTAAFMIVVQPAAEGLAFRAITQPALRRVAGAWGGLLLAAVVSGVFHALVYPPNYNTASTLTPLWYGLLIPIIEAALFGLVRASSQSTRAAIAAQAAFGLFAVVKLLALTGR